MWERAQIRVLKKKKCIQPYGGKHSILPLFREMQIKLQWNVNLHYLEQLLSRKQEISNVEEIMGEEKNPCTLLEVQHTENYALWFMAIMEKHCGSALHLTYRVLGDGVVG